LGLKPAAVSAAPAFFFGWNATDTLGAPACELAAWYCVTSVLLSSSTRGAGNRHREKLALPVFYRPFWTII
jgi:hypothetical protein